MFSFTHVTKGQIRSFWIGSLIANTLAVRNVTVVVLDIDPVENENCDVASRHLVRKR